MRRRRALRRLVYFVSGVMLGSWAALTPGDSFSARPAMANVGAGDSQAQARGGVDAAGTGLRSSDPAEALRHAMAARDPMVAAARFAAVASDFEIISDHASLLRAQKLMEAQLQAEAAAACAAALELYDKSPLRADFYEILGSARASLSDEDGAREAWTRGIRATRDSDRQAALRLSVAESLERSHLINDALTIYRKIWTRHASADQAEIAEARLDILERTPKATQRDASDWRKRGDQLFRKRMNAEALRAYDKALAGKLKKSEANRAQKQRAHTLFRMRDYPDSVKAFSALP
ncbi:MAG: hypothetical protein JRG89_06880, partial [Deltaproteobacteria bacterium]|nr:hypothetical protein [Deltaproteobacteria bacterium]